MLVAAEAAVTFWVVMELVALVELVAVVVAVVATHHQQMELQTQVVAVVETD
jgi:hypothetical protein